MKCKNCNSKNITKKIVGLGFLTNLYQVTCLVCNVVGTEVVSLIKLKRRVNYGKRKKAGTRNNTGN